MTIDIEKLRSDLKAGNAWGQYFGGGFGAALYRNVRILSVATPTGTH